MLQFYYHPKHKHPKANLMIYVKKYSNIQTKIMGPEGVHKIKEQIGKYEIFLLKELNFNVPEEFPFDYIYVYSDLLYPDNEQ